MTQPPDLDPSAVLTLLAAVVVGPGLAAVIGPYAVIVVAALAGASWALSEDTAASAAGALWFLLRITITAAVLTSVIVTGLERYVLPSGAEAQSSRWLIAPVAFLIGWVGKDWPRLLRWVSGLLGRLAEARFRRQGDDDAKR